MLELIYFVIIAVMAVLLLVNLLKKKDWPELVSIAVVLVTFALRALHIK